MMKKDLPFADKINKCTLELTEKGFVSYWYSQAVMFLEKLEIKHDKYEAKPLTLKTMQVPFFILILGLALAFLSFLVELKLKQITPRHHKKTILFSLNKHRRQ